MQPRRGYRDRVTTPGDESRTELAWREIVENYGERPVLPDDAPGQASEDTGRDLGASPGETAPTAYDEGLDDSLQDGLDEQPDHTTTTRDAVPEVERFQPPVAPPFPRPRTWQRGLAWTGLFVAPVLALVVGLFSLGLPSLVGWTLVLWFVGGFLYLVREMPKSPRDPWDDGSRI